MMSSTRFYFFFSRSDRLEKLYMCDIVRGIVHKHHISWINHSSACVSVCALICDIRIIRIVLNDNIAYASFISRMLRFVLILLLFLAEQAAIFFFNFRIVFFSFVFYCLSFYFVFTYRFEKQKIKCN